MPANPAVKRVVKPVPRMTLAPQAPKPAGGILAQKWNVPVVGAVPAVAVLGLLGVLFWQRKKLLKFMK